MQNAVEDVWDLSDLVVSMLVYHSGLTAMWQVTTNRSAKVGAAVITILFVICLVLGLLLILPADATQDLSWTPFHDACIPHPCGSHGRCMDLKELEYTCLCDTGWAGPACEVALACASSPCQAGGGVCEDESDGSFVCVCNQGYTGELCDQVGQGKPCEDLTLTNGQVDGQCTGPGTARGSCFLTCLDRHLLFSQGVLMSSGRVTRSCQPDGTWTGMMPVCEQLDCGGTAAVAYSIQGRSLLQHATCSGDTRYGGDACSISCDTGFYRSSGSASLTCGTGGTWLGSPVCSECTAIPRCSGDVTCTSDSDQQCSQCEAGYTANAQCGIVDCGPTIAGLDSQATASCTGNTQYGGDDCTATCNEGWQSAAGVHQGTAVFSCSASAEAWAGSLVCSPMSCGALALANGLASGDCGGAVGDSCVMVSCEAGYSLSHPSGTTRECQPAGSWSGVMVNCIGIPCTINTAIANSDRTTSNPCVTGTGSDCIFTCEAGFHVQGVHTCSSNGLLSGGSCEPIDCGIGLTLQHSPTTCAGGTGDHCAYTCNTGFTVTTPHVCGADWAFTGGACVPCSAVLQEMLDWLETDGALFSFCPTADVKPYQGVLTVMAGKELNFDGSAGPGGIIHFNGDFRSVGGRFGSVTLRSVQVVPTAVVWSAGNNADGQLGLGDSTDPRLCGGVSFPQFGNPTCSMEQLPLPTNVVQAATGGSSPRSADGRGEHTVLLDANGIVWATGRNLYGELGLGDTLNRNAPVPLSEPTGVVQVAAGGWYAGGHTILVCDDGSVWATGQNDAGQLGLGDTTNRHSPQQLPEPTGIVEASAGVGWNTKVHTILLGQDGRVWATGGNSDGQLGLGGGGNRYSPEQLPAPTGIVQVSAGAVHTMLLDAQGEVWATGNNAGGQLGLGDRTNRDTPQKIPTLSGIVQVAVGGTGRSFHTVFLDQDGDVWSTGNGNDGQLGLEDTWDRNVPEQMQTVASISHIAAGGYHTMLVDRSGVAYGTGWDGFGLLGLDSTADGHQNSPQPLPSPTRVVYAAAGSEHTILLAHAVPDCGSAATVTYSPTSGVDYTSQIACSGDTEYGGDDCAFACARGYYLSTGTAPMTCEVDGSWSAAVCTQCTVVPGCVGFVSCSSESNEQCTPCSSVLQELLEWLSLEIAPFDFHYCPTVDVTERQGVLTVKNDGRQLTIDGGGGPGGSIFFNGAFRGPRGTRTDSVTLLNARTISMSVWVIGDNSVGELGLGDTIARESLEQLNALGSDVAQVAVGGSAGFGQFSAALTEGGQVYLWGTNDYGQVGNGECTLSSSGSCRCDECTGQNLVSPTHIAMLGTDTVQLALGQAHVLALKQAGAVYCWGKSEALGLGDTNHRNLPTEISSLGADNAYIATSAQTSMVLKSDGRLFSWGRNNHGSVGDGTTTDRLSPVHLTAVGSDNAHVAAGWYHTLLLKADGSVLAWGWNGNGQIGNGGTYNQVRANLCAHNDCLAVLSLLHGHRRQRPTLLLPSLPLRCISRHHIESATPCSTMGTSGSGEISSEAALFGSTNLDLKQQQVYMVDRPVAMCTCFQPQRRCARHVSWRSWAQTSYRLPRMNMEVMATPSF